LTRVYLDIIVIRVIIVIVALNLVSGGNIPNA